MKTVTKFLSMLLLVAMCLSLFGGSAYALELGGSASTPGSDVSSVTASGSSAGGFEVGGADASGTQSESGTDTLSDDLEIDDSVYSTRRGLLRAPVAPPVADGEAQIGTTVYETLADAIAKAQQNDTIKLLKNVTTNSIITISVPVTIDLNDFKWTLNKSLNINAAVTVTDTASTGILDMYDYINVYAGLKFNNIDLYCNSNSGFSFGSGGKVTMDYVWGNGNLFANAGSTSQMLVNSGCYEYRPNGLNAPGTVISERTDGRFEVRAGEDTDITKYQASIGSTYYTTLSEAFQKAVSGDTIVIVKQSGKTSVSGAELTDYKNVTLDLSGEDVYDGGITVTPNSSLTITNGKFNAGIINNGTLTVSSSAELVALSSYGTTYVNGKIDTINISSGNMNVSDTAEITTINVANAPTIYVPEGSSAKMGSINKNPGSAPRQVYGGIWSNSNVDSYVADNFEAKQQTSTTWIVQRKGVTPTPTPSGKPVNASVSPSSQQYYQKNNSNAVKFTVYPANSLTSMVAYTASGSVTLNQGSDYGYNSSTGAVTIYSTYLEKIKAQTVTLYFYFAGETNPATALVYVIPYCSLNTGSYYRNTGNAVYFDMSTGSAYGYRYGTSTDFAYSQPLYSSNYTETNGSNGYVTLRLNNSFLDSLASNQTYYFFYVLDNSNTRYRMERNGLTIDSKSPSVGGDYMIDYLDSAYWYYGDSKLGFRVSPLASGGIAVDNWGVPGEEYVDSGTGKIYLGTALLKELKTGWHTLTAYYGEYGEEPSRSIDFYVGPYLKPVDTDKHVINSSKNLKFVCSDSIAKVYVGDKLLDDEYYTISRDGKYLTLKAGFLNARMAGETYNLSVLTVNNEYASTTFRILTTAQASSSPRTGDESNMGLWLAFLIVSGGAAIAVVPRLRKGKD